MSGEAKVYEAEGLRFEFNPNGSPYAGLLTATDEQHGTYTADVSLTKARSRKAYAEDAADLYSMDADRLNRALTEICTLRTEEVATAATEQEREEEVTHPEPLAPEAETLISSRGVLDRYVEDVARICGVVGDRDALKLQTLVAVGAQLAPLPNGKPAGANLISTAEAGRGKNFISDATTTGLPEDFYFAFESASAKSLYYKAESDPQILKHCWIYANEAEATDELVEMFRPLLSGGRASHLTVNKTEGGRNAAQELSVEGPVSITIPTVRNKLDTQLQTRMLVAELPDYEGRVAAHSRAISRQLLPDHAGENHSPKVRAWKAALRSLTAIRRVVFPLDRDDFCFHSDTVSHGARLWGNLLGLMLAHAWLEQRNRNVVDLGSGERAIVATPVDYETAYQVFKATCERSVVNLSDTHRRILTAVHDLKQESELAEGFSQRKIAEKAGVSVSTVSEHKTYLTKSVKLLREVEEGGLTLVADAEPSWWEKGDLLVGFPRPEQVCSWWEEEKAGSSKSTEHTEQSPNKAQESLGNAGKAVRHSAEQPPNSGERPRDGEQPDEDVRQESGCVRQGIEHEKGLGKRQSRRGEGKFGMFGNSESGDSKCKHEVPGGCWLCKREIEHLIEQGAAPHLARAEVLGLTEKELEL